MSTAAGTPPAGDLAHASIADLGRLLDARQVSAVELARLFLDRIAAHRDPNAFLDVRPEVTLAQAASADARRARGETGALRVAVNGFQGVPVHEAFASLGGCNAR